MVKDMDTVTDLDTDMETVTDVDTNMDTVTDLDTDMDTVTDLNTDKDTHKYLDKYQTQACLLSDHKTEPSRFSSPLQLMNSGHNRNVLPAKIETPSFSCALFTGVY